MGQTDAKAFFADNIAQGAGSEGLRLSDAVGAKPRPWWQFWR